MEEKSEGEKGGELSAWLFKVPLSHNNTWFKMRFRPRGKFCKSKKSHVSH